MEEIYTFVGMENNINESHCSFELSKVLKEKGFNVGCKYFYHSKDKIESIANKYPLNSELNNQYSRPTHALAIEWLRVNFGIWVYVNMRMQPDMGGKQWYYVVDGKATNDRFLHPEDAINIGLITALKWI